MQRAISRHPSRLTRSARASLHCVLMRRNASMETDYLSLGLAAARRRAWFARCRAAPVPPPPARPVSVAELDAAVAAALARGTSSLEEKRMGRIALSQIPERAPGGRAPCAVCGLALARAVPSIPICRHCADSPDAVRARLDGRRQAAERAIAAATAEAQAARDALDARDAARWDKIAAALLASARLGGRAGTATPEQRAWLDKVKAAIHNPASPAVSDALRRVWHADEALYWTVGGASDDLRRVEVVRLMYEECLSGLVEEPCNAAV